MDVMYAAGAGCAGAAIYMDVVAEKLLLHFRHFRRPWRSYAARGHDHREVGGRVTPGAVTEEVRSGDLHGCNGRKLLLHFRHFRHPWRSADNYSCIICTSAIPGGRQI